jgi:hypothetical protein
MINKMVRLSFLAILLVLTACTSTTVSSLQPSGNHQPATATSDPSKKIFFPRQEKTDGERAVMEALIGGSLVLVDNCIRVHNEEVDINYLLICHLILI